MEKLPLSEENEFATPMFWSLKKLMEHDIKRMNVYKTPVVTEENPTIDHYVLIKWNTGVVAGVGCDANGWSNDDVGTELESWITAVAVAKGIPGWELTDEITVQ